VADKILELLHQTVTIKGHVMRVDCSIGMAIYPQHGDTEELLIRHADLALYDAKRSGAVHQWRIFENTMNDIALRRITLESELQLALERKEFKLHYQPQVSLADGSLTGVEALVRWEHPKYGLILPDKFIPLAEDTGLIWELGQYVLESACDQIADWHARNIVVPRMSVNISPSQLRNCLLDYIQNCLVRRQIKDYCLELEITESALTADGPLVLELLEGIKQLGVNIAVDDFGIGYSSLSLMRRLPIDCLKVDKSFVDEILVNRQDRTIVDAILRMGTGLGLRTLAEGVETAEQRDALLAMGCQEAQGYFFARPMAANYFEAWLRYRAAIPE
jgi:EAL domain-containing protein (putative c-di-GMP-specific phosphodiesterase class I)